MADRHGLPLHVHGCHQHSKETRREVRNGQAGSQSSQCPFQLKMCQKGLRGKTPHRKSLMHEICSEDNTGQLFPGEAGCAEPVEAMDKAPPRQRVWFWSPTFKAL